MGCSKWLRDRRLGDLIDVDAIDIFGLGYRWRISVAGVMSVCLELQYYLSLALYDKRRPNLRMDLGRSPAWMGEVMTF